MLSSAPARLGLPDPGPGVRPRVSDRERGEDVEVPRHLHQRVEAFLKYGELSFAGDLPPLVRIKPYEHLLTRIEPKRIAALVMENTLALTPTRSDGAAPLEVAPIAQPISIEDFARSQVSPLRA